MPKKQGSAGEHKGSGKNAGVFYALEIMEHWKKHNIPERLECLSTVLGYIFAWTWSEFGEKWICKVAEKMHRIIAISGASPDTQKSIASRLFGLITFFADVCPHESAVKRQRPEKPHPCCAFKCKCRKPATMTIEHHLGLREPGNICVCDEHAEAPAKAMKEILPLVARGEGLTAITIWPRRPVTNILETRHKPAIWENWLATVRQMVRSAIGILHIEAIVSEKQLREWYDAGERASWAAAEILKRA